MDLTAALRESPRAALVELAGRLAGEIDAASSARDRLPLVRAFLAAVTAVETFDAQARREARRNPTPAGEPTVAPLDELLERRRRGRRAG